MATACYSAVACGGAVGGVDLAGPREFEATAETATAGSETIHSSASRGLRPGVRAMVSIFAALRIRKSLIVRTLPTAERSAPRTRRATRRRLIRRALRQRTFEVTSRRTVVR